MNTFSYPSPLSASNCLYSKLTSYKLNLQRSKLVIQKLKFVKPEEAAATMNALEIKKVHSRLASQYMALELEYRRVIQRMEYD